MLSISSPMLLLIDDLVILCIKYLDGTNIDFAELHEGQTMKVPVIASHPEEFSFFQKEVFWK